MHPTGLASFTCLEHLGTPLPEIVYLLHLDPPYRWAAHYMGSTDDLERRLSEHGGPDGARLLLVQKQAGGSWHLVRTWAGGRQKESELKSNNGKRYCPECTQRPLPGINTVYRHRKTRNQRRREQLAVALAACEPEPVPLWVIERTPVPVTDDEWLANMIATRHAIAAMSPHRLAAVEPWHPAADFTPAILNRSQAITVARGYR
jgi:predicted GIY-YIG superfamily endonuclease